MRTTLFGVATVTEVVGCIGFYKFLSNRAMRIVATGATHLALAERHMGEAHLSRHLLFMALVACFHYRGLRE
jgi:hypothetical protein